MPNNTDVRVYIDHTNKKRIDDMENIFSNDYPFNMIIPMPDDIERGNLTMEQREATNGRNWYDWSCANWGTKWDAYNINVQRLSDTSLYVTMETAWSPPIPIFQKLLELGFEVSAYYLDEGYNYVGQFEGGEDFCYDVDYDTPYNLIDEFDIQLKGVEE